MAQSPQKSLSDFTPDAQRKTLFLPAPGMLGVIVQMDPKPSRRERRFLGPDDALRWCLANRVNLFYFFADDSHN
jgi:hypothetical protein